jgi:peptide subunit release factor 1 (eRF1)
MVQAEQSKDFGNYTVHYSAFTSDNLTPSIAKQYNIPRSKKRALLNVSILKKTADGTSRPTRAIVKGTTTNLSQQLRELDPREISEKGAIYYIAETPVDNAETLKYNLEITPEGESTTYTLTFQEQFYTE